MLPQIPLEAGSLIALERNLPLIIEQSQTYMFPDQPFGIQ